MHMKNSIKFKLRERARKAFQRARKDQNLEVQASQLGVSSKKPR